MPGSVGGRGGQLPRPTRPRRYPSPDFARTCLCQFTADRIIGLPRALGSNGDDRHVGTRTNSLTLGLYAEEQIDLCIEGVVDLSRGRAGQPAEILGSARAEPPPLALRRDAQPPLRPPDA